MSESAQYYSIGAVERDTGVARDTLRVWERRYGFPSPQRNTKGERLYSEQQLRQLQRIQRLLGQGYRPGKLLRLSGDDLLKIETELGESSVETMPVSVQTLIDAATGYDSEAFEDDLNRLYEKQGMRKFILKTIVPLLRAVGELWVAGKMQIYQEHFLSEQLLRFFSAETAKLQKHCKKPVVLLATLPGEQHTLGLMMVAAMLASHKVSTLNLGGEVPVDQIAAAADQFDVDVVGVTFSSAYHYPSIRQHLEELRDSVSEGVEIWAGGEGMRRMRKLPQDVSKFVTLESLPV